MLETGFARIIKYLLNDTGTIWIHVFSFSFLMYHNCAGIKIELKCNSCVEDLPGSSILMENFPIYLIVGKYIG